MVERSSPKEVTTMKKLLIGLLFVMFIGCSEETIAPPTSALKTSIDLRGRWELSQIEIKDSTGSHVFTECYVPATYYYYQLIDLNIATENSAEVILPCLQQTIDTQWTMVGKKITFSNGQEVVTGEIIQVEATTMIIQFELTHTPFYYYTKK